MRTVPTETTPFPVLLNRNSFGPRLVARAGDVWRAMQDVVVDQSSEVGWPPEKFEQVGTMFVVRTMAVVHHRAVRFAESLVGRTWPSRARRDMLFTRQVRLFSGDELVAAGTQEWAYLSRALQPTRVGPELYAAFTILEGYPTVGLPEPERAAPGPTHQLTFRTWHLWMDPLGHVNHPAYVDYCDESTARVLAAAGVDPQRLDPVAEEVHFRAAIGPQVQVTVETTLKGHLGDDAVLGHRVIVGGKVAATGTTVRRLAGERGRAWHQAFGAAR